MDKWKGFVIPLVIINFVVTFIILCYLIIMPYDRHSCNCNSNNNVTGITGFVTKIDKRSDGITMLVENSGSIGDYDRASITVTNDTFIIKTIYSRTFKPEEINIGDLVEVQFTGPVRESYPIQADAKSVWIKESSIK